MKIPDLDRANSEKPLTRPEFIRLYNDGLPEQFPRISPSILDAFSENYPSLFRTGQPWSLDQHRKKVMDWLPAYLRSQTAE